jgi:hypothetical protein
MGFLDLTGCIFGLLEVKGIDHQKKVKSGKKYIYWFCHCECGNDKIVRGDALRSGKTQSCGCDKKILENNYSIDLTGQKFGKLTVIEFDHKEKSKTNGRFRYFWKCICDCSSDQIIQVDGVQLRTGHKKSCGCLPQDRGNEKVLDLIGQKFYHLTVIERVDKPKGYKSGGAWWKCQCDCGNPKEIIIKSLPLRSGETKSCGCAYNEHVDAINDSYKGLIFGKLEVIKRIYEFETVRIGKGQYVLCHCQCGNDIITEIRSLRDGQLFSCGCDRPDYVRPLIITDLKDRIFGELTAIRMVKKPKGRKNGTYWLCRCSCGKDDIIRSNELIDGEVELCGECRKKKNHDAFCYSTKLPEGVAQFNAVYKNIEHGAKIRGLEFSLTKDEVRNLIFKNCHYCNSSPSNVSTGYSGSCVYNGLDRVNPNKGYILDNVVPCCYKCNVAKWDMQENEFFDWISKTYNYLVSTNCLPLPDSIPIPLESNLILQEV